MILTLLFASNEDPGTIFSLPLQENIFDVKKAPSHFIETKLCTLRGPTLIRYRISLNHHLLCCRLTTSEGGIDSN